MLTSMICGPAYVLAQSVPEASSPAIDCEGTIDAWVSSGYYHPGDCQCINGQPVCGKAASGGHFHRNHHDFNQEIKLQIAGTIFESLLTSLFTDNTANEKEALAARQKAAALAAQQAEFEKARAAAAQAAYEKMMKSYKQLDDSQGVAFKTLSDSNLQLKTLDGDAESLEANARKPFDTPSDTASTTSGVSGKATPFFGDTMPLADIRLLVNPENDPRVADLRNASAYMVKSLKDESANPAAGNKPHGEKDNGKPRITPAECARLKVMLNGYIGQRSKFEKTINLAQGQLNEWETENRNAMVNAAKDGIEYFTGQLLEGLANRGKAADRLQQIYEKNAGRMAKDGIDVAAMESKIKRLKMLSSAGRISELAGNIKDWQTFIKDGMSALMAQLTSSNMEVREMLNDPKMQKYFGTASPELNTLLDISTIAAANKVFGKWVAEKVPIIAGVQLSINESYNGLDWLLSFKRMTEANKINGKVLEAARALQGHIDETAFAMRECSP
ncbi:MAG: hypothetical protein M0033_09715 [Nitrospiraceae bacterium]|nr:hypothetical protein [Nitrospiraceae bacterium]